MYYGLSNFYQNHRRYVKSRDDHQLLGALGDVSNECSPFDRVPVDTNRNVTDYKQVVPCGAIANSLFNGNFVEWVVYTSSLKENIFRRYFASLQGRWHFTGADVEHRDCLAL